MSAEPWPPDVALASPHASLRPLVAADAPGLALAAADGDAALLWFTSAPAPDAVGEEIARRLALRGEGAMLPFTVLVGNEPAGMTTYMNIDVANRRLEIGSTWYRQSCRRTAVNTACKRLLLAHAFETLDCIAVEFRTHLFNTASRRAIERLGAKLDGILRSHQIGRAGELRDTCVYSIIAAEWPAVRANLDWRLAGAPGT